jgi:hypothetical protein
VPETRIASDRRRPTGAAILGVYLWIVIRAWPPTSIQQALRVGLLWITFAPDLTA